MTAETLTYDPRRDALRDAIGPAAVPVSTEYTGEDWVEQAHIAQIRRFGATAVYRYVGGLHRGAA